MGHETLLDLDCSADEASSAVKAVFERMDSISEYYHDDDRIIGKTGPRLSSWGEAVIVTINENGRPGETTIAVTAEQDNGLDLFADPERYRTEFVDHVEDRNVEDNLLEPSKEVDREDDLYDGGTHAILIGLLAGVFLFGILFVPSPYPDSYRFLAVVLLWTVISVYRWWR